MVFSKKDIQGLFIANSTRMSISSMIIQVPDKKNIKAALKLYDNFKYWKFSDGIIQKFLQAFPKHNDRDTVSVKIDILNTFYSANVRAKWAMADHIVKLDKDIN